eukprot:CAMPEP_0113964608 /NCGR_PEP_ID=MMETSP0011_2-20120614/7249_1 /TAXON_ID=101924 /ORGANISM="Rhodosorus marinus" /LENGTH=200 /DNA_ID=CAMNT_0000976959 /DNA_START=30 /DNA_END=633 /DNA_ORIENTATION=+ /assembly_acc=CAM_ASM_000156
MSEVVENVVTSEEVEKAVDVKLSPRPEKPRFERVKARDGRGLKTQFRKVLVPTHRYTPLKSQWTEIYKPLVENLKLQVRMNLKSRCVEMKVSPHTEDPEAIQKGADFVKAFILGFEIRDSLALLRIDDLFIESFEIHDGKFSMETTFLEQLGGSRERMGKLSSQLKMRPKRESFWLTRKFTSLGRTKTLDLRATLFAALS